MRAIAARLGLAQQAPLGDPEGAGLGLVRGAEPAGTGGSAVAGGRGAHRAEVPRECQSSAWGPVGRERSGAPVGGAGGEARAPQKLPGFRGPADPCPSAQGGAPAEERRPPIFP